MRLAAVLALVPDVEPPELTDWIARGWVLPEGEPPEWAFAEMDVARVRLIRDLRHAIGVEEATLPLVLNLLDQVYDLRRLLRDMLGEADPAPVQAALRRALLSRIR